MSKNPNEILTIGRGANTNKKVMLVVENCLTVPSDSDIRSGKCGPLEEPKYSRFKMTILQKDERATSICKCNIPAAVVDGIFDRYKEAASVRQQIKVVIPATIKLFEEKYGDLFARLDQFLGSNTSAKPAKKSGPYKCRFYCGTLKGKTIPDVLGDKPKENIGQLKSQAAFLEKNIDAYPANKALVDEIKRAIEEVESGTYNTSEDPAAAADAASAGEEVAVYIADNNFLKTQVDAENRVFCYNLHIVCETGKDMPWVISLMNGYCPLEENAATHRELPKYSQMVGRTTATFRLTDQEFSYLIGWMVRNRAEFISAHYAEQMEKAKALSYTPAK